MRGLVGVVTLATLRPNGAEATKTGSSRRRLLDIDGDGNKDQYGVSTRADSPHTSDYEAYFHAVVDTFGCDNGYYGYGCSKRLCAFAAAWAVDPYMLSDPSDDLYTPWGRSDYGGMHSYQECAGKGVCNRKNGKCKCFPGYHGNACKYKACPNDCGDHGVCQPNYVINPAYTATIPQTSQVWDRERTFRCVCDYGYSGIDCSDRVCPTGLDPVNSYDVRCSADVDRSADFFGWDQQVIRIPDTMPEGQHFFLEFETAFGGQPFRTHPIQYDSSLLSLLAGDIQEALQRLPNQALPSIQTRVLDNDAGYAATVLVAFTDATTSGRQQLLSCVAPSTTEALACESGVQPKVKSLNVDAVECETNFYNDASELYTAYECSGRGECDQSNGKCACHSGFSGLRCEQMNSFY